MYSKTLDVTQAVQQKIIELASISLGRDLKISDVDEPLQSTKIGFDSIALMEFILHLEQEFEINIPDEDLDPDIFYTVDTVASYILRRQREAK